jgi:hypothetical protein
MHFRGFIDFEVPQSDQLILGARGVPRKDHLLEDWGACGAIVLRVRSAGFN